MGDFDLSLIREFRSCPAFYDRNSSRFKDKIFTAHEWQNISNKLGYDVSLLKDRMLQLRNRYNLEKRRMETLREENPGKRITSPWPLYDQLHFLSDHIRARRSYKRMAPIQAAAAVSAELSNSGSNPSLSPEAAPFANGLLAVKMEENDSDDDVESESPSGPETGVFVASDHPAMLAQATLRDHSTNSASSSAAVTAGAAVQDLSMHLPTSLPPSITIRRLDTMREAALQQQQQQRQQQQQQHQQQHHQQQQQQQLLQLQHQQQFLQQHQQRPPKRSSFAKNPAATAENHDEARLNARERKYAAFGHFMSSSLLEMPPKKALLLVEKFTSELVKVLVQKSDAADAQAQSQSQLSLSSPTASSVNGDGGDANDITQ